MQIGGSCFTGQGRKRSTLGSGGLSGPSAWLIGETRQVEDYLQDDFINSTIYKNPDDRRMSKILGSMVSKAADRSRRQRHEIWREPMASIR